MPENTARAKKMKNEKYKNAVSACAFLQRAVEPWVMLLSSKYDWFVHEWQRMPAAMAVAAAKVKTQFKKSKMNKMTGHARAAMR